MSRASLDIIFSESDALAQSGPGTYVQLNRPNGDGHVFWAEIGTSVEPSLGALTYHPVTVPDGSTAQEVKTLFVAAIEGTGFWEETTTGGNFAGSTFGFAGSESQFAGAT